MFWLDDRKDGRADVNDLSSLRQNIRFSTFPYVLGAAGNVQTFDIALAAGSAWLALGSPRCVTFRSSFIRAVQVKNGLIYAASCVLAGFSQITRKPPFMRIGAIHAALVVAALGLAACGQQEQFRGYTCTGWGAANCTPAQVPGEVFAKENARGLPLVILVHTSGGVTQELRENARRISQENYVVLVLNHYAARGIRESHTAYAQAVSMGANARTMTLDVLSAMNGLRDDPRVDVSRTVVVGFSAGSITGHWLNSLQFAAAHAPLIPQPTTLPRAVIAMYGCPAEFDERMTMRGIPHHFVVGSLDSQLENCRIYDRMMRERGYTHTGLLVIPDAHHSFDAPYYVQTWPANQEVRRCFAILHRDGSATNPHIRKTYPRYTYAALMADCATRGEVAGNNGDRWVGYAPMMQLIRRYTDATTAPR